MQICKEDTFSMGGRVPPYLKVKIFWTYLGKNLLICKFSRFISEKKQNVFQLMCEKNNFLKFHLFFWSENVPYRVCHIFIFSKNPEIFENLYFWVIRGLARNIVLHF